MRRPQEWKSNSLPASPEDSRRVKTAAETAACTGEKRKKNQKEEAIGAGEKPPQFTAQQQQLLAFDFQRRGRCPCMLNFL